MNGLMDLEIPETMSFTISKGFGDFSLSFSPFLPELDEATLTGASFCIIQDRNICGGAPIINGTRISVHHLVAQMQALGWTKERLARSYPHLSAEQIDAAMAYYEANKSEIEGFIEREE